MNNHGTPLPNPKDPSRLPDYGRDADRVFAAKPPGADDTTIFPQKEAVKDSRVRDHRAQQYREWFRRAKGRVATDAEVATFLGEEGGR